MWNYLRTALSLMDRMVRRARALPQLRVLRAARLRLGSAARLAELYALHAGVGRGRASFWTTFDTRQRWPQDLVSKCDAHDLESFKAEFDFA